MVTSSGIHRQHMRGPAVPVPKKTLVHYNDPITLLGGLHQLPTHMLERK